LDKDKELSKDSAGYIELEEKRGVRDRKQHFFFEELLLPQIIQREAFTGLFLEKEIFSWQKSRVSILE
jgi:hypothetical protein